MKIAMIIVRTLMGLMFLFASLAYFFKLVQQPELTGNMQLFMTGMDASGYLMTFVKLTELVCAIAFITGFFVPLATVVIFPVMLNIVFTHLFLAPEGLPMALILLAGNLFLAYYYRHLYVPFLRPKG